MAELKIKAYSGGGTVSFKGPATTTSNAAVQLTLPVDDGTANQYLKTDGSGALSWATVDTSIADDSIVEAKLDVSNAPTNGQFLQAQSGEGGGLTWAAAGGTAPVFGRVKRTSADVTTTSTSLVDFTGASITFTTGAFPIMYGQIATSRNSTTGAMIAYNVMIDSTLELGTTGIATDHPVANYNQDYSFTGQSVALSAASHTVKLQWNVSAGTGLTNADSDYAHVFWAHEIR